jgi:hypothetical protein
LNCKNIPVYTVNPLLSKATPSAMKKWPYQRDGLPVGRQFSNIFSASEIWLGKTDDLSRGGPL